MVVVGVGDCDVGVDDDEGCGAEKTKTATILGPV